MNITPSERAAMVKDLERLMADYQCKTSDTENYHFNVSMVENYHALASALKEGLKFNEVA